MELPEARKAEGAKLRHLTRNSSTFFFLIQAKESSATLSPKSNASAESSLFIRKETRISGWKMNFIH